MSKNVSGAATTLLVCGRKVEFYPLKDIEIQGIENDERNKHIAAALQAARETNCTPEELGMVSKGAVEACIDFDFLGPWGRKQIQKPQFLAKLFAKSAKDKIDADEALSIVISDPVNKELIVYACFGRLMGIKPPEKLKESTGEKHPTQESQSIAS